MKTIIIPGKEELSIVRLTCHHCECVFDTNEFDDEHKTKCPQCGNEVSLFSLMKNIFSF